MESSGREMEVPGDQEPVRCAAFHTAAEADPAGNAPTWDAVLVVGVPLPWPRDIALAEPFASALPAPAPTMVGPDGRVWRPQAVVPEGEGVSVIAYERPDRRGTSGPDRRGTSGPDRRGTSGPDRRGTSGPFGRREWSLPSDDPARLRRLARAIIAADPAVLDEFDSDRCDPAPGTVDLLVCTHGSRDVCCGGSGTALHKSLAERAHPGVRVWRTSHTGGHRFAPTALSFPDGHAWAHLDVDTAARIAARSGEVASVGRHMRGSLSVAGAQEQVADREAFVVHGWEWLAIERSASVLERGSKDLSDKEPDADGTTVEVTGTLGTGEQVSTRCVVELDRRIAKPACGVAESEPDTEAVWKVRQ